MRRRRIPGRAGRGGQAAFRELAERRPATETTEIIAQLEDLLDRQTRWHFFRRAWGVDEAAFFRIINRLRASLPHDIRQAEQIVKEADEIIGRAREQAARIVEQGRQQAEALVQESEITREAQKRAEKTIADAQEESQRLRREVEQYCLHLLSELESHARRVAQAAERGREALGPPAAE